MASQEHASEGLTDVERWLKSLAVRDSQIDRGRLMYLAGRASVRREKSPRHTFWIWPTATAVSATFAVILVALLATRPQPRVVRVTEYVNLDTTRAVAAEELSDSSTQVRVVTPDAEQQKVAALWMNRALLDSPKLAGYLSLRRFVVQHGVEALPATATFSEARAIAEDQSDNSVLHSERTLRVGTPWRVCGTGISFEWGEQL